MGIINRFGSPVDVKVKVKQATDTAHSLPALRRGGRLSRFAWQEWVRSGHALGSGKMSGNAAYPFVQEPNP